MTKLSLEVHEISNTETVYVFYFQGAPLLTASVKTPHLHHRRSTHRNMQVAAGKQACTLTVQANSEATS